MLATFVAAGGTKDIQMYTRNSFRIGKKAINTHILKFKEDWITNLLTIQPP